MNIENLYTIKEYLYTQEIHFIEEKLEEELPKDLDEAIKFCEENYVTNFIGYNLLILKRDLEQLNNKK